MFEDFPVGTRLPMGPYAVTRDEIVAFAQEYDPQPMHLDEGAAADSLLGGLSASGWHVCGMMMRMMCDAFIHSSSSQGSPGVDFVNWLAPERPGDSLTGETEVLDARGSASRPHIGFLKLRTWLQNQAGERVIESEYSVMLHRREAA